MSTTKMMQAIQVKKHGDAGVLQLSEVQRPEPTAGQALVRIHAAGLNYIDIYQRTGFYPIATPYIPGFEAAGVVEAVAPGVTDVKVGDRVAYVATPGAYAEFATVDAWRLIPLPQSLSFAEGAAIPLQGITAHYLLHEYHVVKPGDSILIHAAAGGMGLLLVQWAKKLGARVIGTVSTDAKADLARKAGADEVILYSRVDFVKETLRLTDGRGVDYVIDGVGKATFPGSLEAVKRRGRVVLYGSASGAADPISPHSLAARALTLSGGTLFNYMDTRDEILTRANAVLRGVEEGWLGLTVGKIFPLAQAADAHRMLEGRESTGKLVLAVRD